MDAKLNDDALAVAHSVGAVPLRGGDDDDALATAMSVGAIPLAESAQEQQPEQESNLGEAALRGLKQTFAPFLLSKDDIKGQHTGAEIATEAGVGIAGDVATGALIGSVIPGAGTAVGAVAFPIAAALYRGMGYERARSQAEGKDFNIGRGLINAVTEVNPLISKGGVLWKMGTQAALEGTREYAYSGDAGAAKAAALVGGGGGALAGGLSKLFGHNGPGWAAVLGQVASKPGSGTRAVGMAGHSVDEMMRSLKSEDPSDIGSYIARNMEHADADPHYFKLGDKLEQYDRHAADVVDDFGDVVKAKRGGKPMQDEHGNLIPQQGASLADDVEGFKKFIADLDGVKAKDPDLESRFESNAGF